MTRNNIRQLVQGICIAASLLSAYGYVKAVVESHYSWYDDEGFMLMTLSQYVSGATLYEGMYTEYGPFYYIAHATLLKILRWPIAHDSIRWLTIISWLIVAVGWSAFVWMWSRSVWWSLAALMATVIILHPFNGEPGHPQVLIQILFMAAIGVAMLHGKLRAPATFALLGAIGTAIAFTKINIGLFFFLALVVMFTASAQVKRHPAILRVILTTLCLAVPAVLMHRHFTQPTAVLQCAIYTYGIGALLYALRRYPTRAIGWVGVSWTAIGSLVVGSFIVLTVLLGGTSLRGLVEGVLLQPLRFSHAVPFQESSGRALGIAGLGCLWSAALIAHARRVPGGRLLDLLQSPVAFGLIVLSVVNPPTATAIAPGVLWLFVPRSDTPIRTTRSQFSARFVISFATFGVLMAYPVSGTQAYIAASLVLVAAYVGFLAGRSQPADIVKSRPALLSPQFMLGSTAFCFAFLAGLGNLLVYSSMAQTESSLPNSHLVHLTPERHATFEEIVSRTSRHCGALVTIPGMNSFHIWSHIPHVNGFTVSSAMVLFDATEQERLRRDFLTARHPCVIFNPALEQWSARFRPQRPSQPFVDLVRNNLVVVYSRSGYEIRVLPGEVEAWRP